MRSLCTIFEDFTRVADFRSKGWEVAGCPCGESSWLSHIGL